uniref:Uncharacterized protein n=1 Tax=Strombidium inclinatum TaxID=197538 RepID=A0A7S3MXM4_9SPIT|mmetsp:Transcript_25521/g.39299  ORF Transcript_25521/g.39299 Transcript_25521/m.39299 type:complete len:247 (+) Transcript_25521:111-851(+)
MLPATPMPYCVSQADVSRPEYEKKGCDCQNPFEMDGKNFIHAPERCRIFKSKNHCNRYELNQDGQILSCYIAEKCDTVDTPATCREFYPSDEEIDEAIGDAIEGVIGDIFGEEGSDEEDHGEKDHGKEDHGEEREGRKGDRDEEDREGDEESEEGGEGHDFDGFGGNMLDLFHNGGERGERGEKGEKGGCHRGDDDDSEDKDSDDEDRDEKWLSSRSEGHFWRASGSMGKLATSLVAASAAASQFI